VTYIVPEDVLEIGRDAYRQLLETLRDCTEKKQWFGHGGGIEQQLQLPRWAVPDEGDDSDGLGLYGWKTDSLADDAA
jgi:hypothetical protein